GLPDAEDQGVAAGGELLPGLLDRELGELGAVVGEEDGSGGCGFWVCGCHVSPRFRSRLLSWSCLYGVLPAAAGSPSLGSHPRGSVRGPGSVGGRRRVRREPR